jgi:activator of HSP90 ATPase
VHTTIQQTVVFADISPEELFDSYLDSTRHGALVGAPASISDRPGTPFWVFAEDAVRGRTLFVHRPAVIAQSWRGRTWSDADADSVLTLTFDPDGAGGTRLQLTHAGVPHHAYNTIAEGWYRMYWRPWRDHLARDAKDASEGVSS